MALLIILFLFALLLLVWLTTLQVITPETGQLMVIKRFEKHVEILGSDVREIKIPENRIDPSFGVTKIRMDDHTSSWRILIFPYRIAHFSYRYKKFKTLQEVEDTGGMIIWQPPIPTDSTGRPTKSKNTPGTIVLGEWNEKTKNHSLYGNERKSSFEFAQKTVFMPRSRPI